MSRQKNISVHLGLLSLLAGLLCNELLLEQFASTDGQITSSRIRSFIILVQLILVGSSIYLLARRPFITQVSVRRWVMNMTLSVMSIVFSLTIAEIVLRTFLPLDPDVGAQHRIPHPVLGWRLKPKATYSREMLTSTIRVTHNSQGWRDVEHRLQKPDGVFRVLVLGDSFMEAAEVPLEQAFARQLERRAGIAGFDIEVMSMAVGGYGTLQEYLVFEQFGKQYAPDLVILAFYAINDVSANGEERHNARVRPHLDPGNPAQWQIVPVDYDYLQRHFLERSTRHKNWANRFVLIRLVNEALRPPRRLHDHIGVSYCKEPAVYTQAWQTTARILNRLQTEVLSIGSQLVVFTVPAMVEVDLYHMQEILSQTPHPEQFCLESAPGNQRLNQILASREIEFIDLLPAFRKASREDGLRLYPLDDAHWNAAGHALAAERVLAELIARKLLGTKGAL